MATDELAAICALASDTTMNNKRLMQLEIVPLAGKPLKLLTGRDDQELAWIATLLRRAMGVQPRLRKSGAAEPQLRTG